MADKAATDKQVADKQAPAAEAKKELDAAKAALDQVTAEIAAVGAKS